MQNMCPLSSKALRPSKRRISRRIQFCTPQTTVHKISKCGQRKQEPPESLRRLTSDDGPQLSPVPCPAPVVAQRRAQSNAQFSTVRICLCGKAEMSSSDGEQNLKHDVELEGLLELELHDAKDAHRKHGQSRLHRGISHESRHTGPCQDSSWSSMTHQA